MTATFTKRQREIMTEMSKPLKFCPVIQTVCRRPSDCQYCFNGFLYTENLGPGDRITDPVLQQMLEETNEFDD